MPENSTCTRLLQTVLTPGEHIERAEAMAQKMKDIVSLEEQLKAASAGIKAKIVQAKKEMKLLGDIVATGSEEREIECRIDKDWDHKEIVVVRLDNNEVIEKRTMTASEAQADLLDRGAQPGKLLSLDGGKDQAAEGDAQEPALDEAEQANLAELQQEVDEELGPSEEGTEAPQAEQEVEEQEGKEPEAPKASRKRSK